mgnify:CR=1 FL=1
MKKLQMYCITINNNHAKIINEIGYIPVGLGKNITSGLFTRDNTNLNISNKNDFYGEYTFHYWLWKNKLVNTEENWIGFCQYRKFWSKKEDVDENIDFEEFNKIILKDISEKHESYDVILGKPLFLKKESITKILKYGKKALLKSPINLFTRNNTIEFHFDMFHGVGNLSKAIDVLDPGEKNDFKDFVKNNVSFNPHNMLICKSKKILISYYESIFPWLERCEKIFGFKNLDSYGLRRIYGFLAERYMSYWFQKYTKIKLMPIYFKDISDFKL